MLHVAVVPVAAAAAREHWYRVSRWRVLVPVSGCGVALCCRFVPGDCVGFLSLPDCPPLVVLLVFFFFCASALSSCLFCSRNVLRVFLGVGQPVSCDVLLCLGLLQLFVPLGSGPVLAATLPPSLVFLACPAGCCCCFIFLGGFLRCLASDPSFLNSWRACMLRSFSVRQTFHLLVPPGFRWSRPRSSRGSAFFLGSGGPCRGCLCSASWSRLRLVVGWLRGRCPTCVLLLAAVWGILAVLPFPVPS